MEVTRTTGRGRSTAVQRGRQRRHARRVVRHVEDPRGAALPNDLHPPRPAHLREPGLDRLPRRPHVVREHGEQLRRQRRVPRLVRADERNPHLARSPALGVQLEARAVQRHPQVGDHPLRIHLHQRRAHLRRAAPQHVPRPGRRLADDGGDAGLEDAGLFPGDLFQRLAQVLRVVARHVRHRRRQRVQDVGAVQPPAQPHLHDGEVHPRLREAEEGERRRRLEEGRAQPLHLRPQPRLRLLQPVDADGPAIDADALRERDQVRRRVHPDREPRMRRAQGGFAEGGDGALAVGAAHVQRTKAPVRISRTGEQRLRPLQPEPDASRGAREEPRTRIVRPHAAPRTVSGAGRSRRAAVPLPHSRTSARTHVPHAASDAGRATESGIPSMWRITRLMCAFIRRRSTMSSSMPCSSRNSAR